MSGLSDIRVLAVEQFGAGPFGSLHLADLGAEVIKIEDPGMGGDTGRGVPPFAEAGDSLFFEGFNRGKRSIALDLRSQAGRAVFHDLVRQSDALLCNLRGDVPERLGLRYEDLQDVNPRIVCCLLSGFGATGPRRTEPAYDYVLQGIAGWMSLTGEPDGPPAKTGLSLVDYAGGLIAALSLVSGVHAARREGRGGDCDVSLFDTAISMLTYPATWWLTGGHQAERLSQSAHPSIVPFGAFATGDGWIMLACVKERFWHGLLDILGVPELAEDERFATMDARRRHRDELTARLEEALGEHPTAHWLERLQAAGIPSGPVNSVADALADPQTVARELVVETEHPRFGTVRQTGTAARGWWPRPEPRRAPRMGEDRDALLDELLGYTSDRIDELAQQGAFGPC